jgi:hypothetical protein
LANYNKLLKSFNSRERLEDEKNYKEGMKPNAGKDTAQENILHPERDTKPENKSGPRKRLDPQMSTEPRGVTTRPKCLSTNGVDTDDVDTIHLPNWIVTQNNHETIVLIIVTT